MALLISGTRVYGNTSIDSIAIVGNVTPYAATSTTTGSLQVTGGAGITGNVYVGGLIDMSSGTLLASPATGMIEYDGTRFYGTADTTSGRGYITSTQYFRLAANTPTALAITPAKYFGGTSQFTLASASTYELEAFLYFTKTTAGSLTVSINQTQAPQFINGTLVHGAVGAQGSQAASTIQMFNNPNANAAFTSSNTLTTGVNHAVKLNAVILTNATNASTANLTVWQSAGTITPLRGSYLKLTRLPSANTGTFVA